MSPLLLLLSVAAAAAAPGPLRHALVVGANDGGPGLSPLRWADADAARFATVLTELGGFAPGDLTLLENPDRAQLEAALHAHAARAAAHPEDLFLFYYSGHADGRGLRLGDELLPYPELKQHIRDVDAEVRLGVLDACRSGEITRIKGFVVDAAFAGPAGLPAEGEAWLTASSADENAQESDQLRGSTFTHYLLSGLRGAADSGAEGGDGVVSLGEAYAYAYDRTLARTAASAEGAQHPGYDFRLQGRGDLALTDVRRGRARLVLPAELAGQVTVLRLPEQTPVADVVKVAGAPLEVALAPGTYLLRHGDGGTTTGELRVGLSEGARLPIRGFAPVSAAAATRKGEDDAPAAPDAEPARAITIALPRVTPELKAAVADTREALARVAAEGRDALDDLGLVLEDPRVPLRAPPVDRVGAPVLVPVCAEPGAPCLSAAAEALAAADGRVALVHPDGGLAALGAVRGGRPDGWWAFFRPDGSRHSAGAWASGVPVGVWTWWHPGGARQQRGRFVAGKRSGLWTEWDAAGHKLREATWAAGVPAGLTREWFAEGRPKSEGAVLDGKKVGRWVTWHPSGARRAAGRYDAEGRTGRWRTWWEGGRLESEGEFRRDLREGPWVFFHPNGQKAGAGLYLAGSKHGSWKEWHADGALAARGRYAQGERVGEWLFVSADGQRRAAVFAPSAAAAPAPQPEGQEQDEGR